MTIFEPPTHPCTQKYALALPPTPPLYKRILVTHFQNTMVVLIYLTLLHVSKQPNEFDLKNFIVAIQYAIGTIFHFYSYWSFVFSFFVVV